ncbi:unnamed protein product [Rotaria socialis]|uniref:Cytochrome P450 n=1 Tax=Rotaria socialis TaxID=392032 RepID=A0A821SI93_9BILA|nr:unnamed protein product [Rotaria socialis]
MIGGQRKKIRKLKGSTSDIGQLIEQIRFDVRRCEYDLIDFKTLSASYLAASFTGNPNKQGKSPVEIFSEFKSRYGDIFQFWFGPTRYIIVSNANDIQHIFTNRHIYDQGNMFIEQFSTLFPNGYITLTG